MAGDVLHDDDGVVNDESGGDGQGHEGEVVEAVAAEKHDGEGADERDGNSDGGDKRGAAISQENKDDDDDKDDREGQGALDVADGGADGGGAVEDDGGVDALRNGGFDGGQFGADAVNGVNDVGAGLAEDDEQNGALAVQVSRGAEVLHGIDDIGDVGEVDGGAFVVADDNGLEVISVGDLIVGDNVGGGDAVGDLAFGEIGILQAQHGLDVRHG